MKETGYTYAAAYTRTLENRMLKKTDFDALLNAPSLEYALRYLSDKGYGKVRKEQSLNAETLLKEENNFIWNEVKDACPKDAPINILLYQNDFHNLKTILKSIFSGAQYESLMLEPYTIPPEEIYHAVTEGKCESLPDILRTPALEAYQILARDEDGQLAEIILDKALFSAVRNRAKKSKDSFLIGWAELNIAIMNMKIAVRGKQSGKSSDFLVNAMLPCEIELENAAQESNNAFEKWCDNELLRYVQSARCKNFGFEPIFGFLISKQFELQAVRIILSGIKRGIPAGTLRERMRDLYV